MRTCKETAALVSKSSRSKLSLNEWLAVQLHLLFCHMCRLHKRQSNIISQATQKLLKNNIATKLPRPARQRIDQALKKSRTKN
jgi:hypothetical protein